jgi:NADPH2:quinone reductase
MASLISDLLARFLPGQSEPPAELTKELEAAVAGGEMRAVRVHEYGPPEVMHVETIPIPVPKENEVLIQIKAIGVNPVDTYIRAGKWDPKGKLVYYTSDNVEWAEKFPFTPGHDAAGIVAVVGSDVTNVKVGDRVYVCDSEHLTGSYAQFMLAPAKRVWKLPDRLSFEQGAALGVPYFTAVRALKYKAHVKAGETILIHGASGGVGLALVQLAHAWGLTVTGTAAHDEGAKLIRACGARLVLNHKDPNHKQELLDATGGKGFDVIIEIMANVNLPVDAEVCAPKGRIVMVGARGTTEIDPWAFISREVDLMGVALFMNTDEEWSDIACELAKGMDGTHWLSPVIEKEIPLDHVALAHKEVIEHHAGGSKGKLILIP